MAIRSKHRLYIFDRHISDAVLRLSVFAISLLLAFTSWLLLLRTDSFIDAVFWPRMQKEIADLAGKEVMKLGTSEKSIFSKAMEQMEKEGAGITTFPDYAERLSPGNQAVDMIRTNLRIMRILVNVAGLITLAFFLLSFLVVRIIYGTGERRWRWVRRLYGSFNKDAASRQPYGYVHSFSPLQRKVFEMSFAASKGNADGIFELRLDRLCEQLWPGEDAVPERRRAAAALAFRELCEEYFYFQIPSKSGSIIKTYSPILPYEDQVRREYVRDPAGREIEVFTAGRFRFSPPLYTEYLKLRYPKLPHPIVYSIDDRKHPFAFRIYLALWELLQDMRRDAPPDMISNTVQINLFTLLDRACLEMSYDHESSLLEQVHNDFSALKDAGFIRGWYGDEHGERIHHLWYKGVELFNYEAAANTYRLNTALLTHKTYHVDLVPWVDLDKIRIVRRRCGYIDASNIPCNRAALPNSPYCKRHAVALDPENPRLFYEKVKALAPPSPEKGECDSSTEPPAVIVTPPPSFNPMGGGGDHGSVKSSPSEKPGEIQDSGVISKISEKGNLSAERTVSAAPVSGSTSPTPSPESPFVSN
ncbi:MAG: hypothetical protein HQM09_16150 [Candidatus Riflebacteria bacterium]|nr:hypothetical protein [Candidatus Riflebacteria bacterium]